MNSGYFYCPYVPLSTTPVLKAKWTREASDDLRASHNIDAEEKLARLIASEIREETDAEILRDLRNIPHLMENEIPLGRSNMYRTAAKVGRIQSVKVNWSKEGF